ncbi:MAG: class I SAM-dependent methyltransferase [Bacillota bacterium]|nr:class I SAM-dependent methyltransferase [Bacillota bacterium]
MLIKDIHPQDEMYQFLASHPDHRNNPLNSYFSSGEGMMKKLSEVFLRTGTEPENVDNFLEFACGYGRFTRHLIMHIHPSKVTVSDVNKEAVDFQEKTFKVKGFYSEYYPAQLKMPEKYDVIFVASLFSHLPFKTWCPWLNKLYHSLSDKGLLIFSTHGPACMGSLTELCGMINPAEGFYYLKASESKIHSTEDYGTTYVTPEFVKAAVLQETGVTVELEIPKYLWDYQDVYVVRKAHG